MNRVFRYFLIVGGAVIGILLFLLASASDNSDFFEQHYTLLFALNTLVVVALLALLVLMLTRLYKRYKRGKFGSKLMARLVLLFAVMGVLPGTVIYLVSVQFVSRSIESWFDVRVESALESGLSLGHTALDALLSDLYVKAQHIASELSSATDEATQIALLSRLHDKAQSQAMIVNASGRVLVVEGQSAGAPTDIPTATILRLAQNKQGFSMIEGDNDLHENGMQSIAPSNVVAQSKKSANKLRLRVVLPITSQNRGSASFTTSDMYFLQLLQAVPDKLADNAESLATAYSEYQVRSKGRSGLRKIYIVTLTLTLLLAIFGAIVSAFLIASHLAKPLLLLAEGTRAVAEGDLSPRPIVSTSDELGTLTQSFNLMTRQLHDARNLVEKNRAELENAKAYLESVLANMSAGVMVLDGDFKLVSCNQSVERILQNDLTPYLGQSLATIQGLMPFTNAIINAFSEQSAQFAAGTIHSGDLHWQHQIEITCCITNVDAHLCSESNGRQNSNHDLTLLVRGSHLPFENGNSYVVVFDDISKMISAQRSIAWGEVARRLAHEIKNPLTPIQLSAERLKMKLEGKLAPREMEMLNKGTATIVNQVSAMKRMVDEFRDYAKTPPAVLLPLDLNALIAEILNLYMVGDDRDIIHPMLADNLPKIMGDATQLRQVIHNLLQNAQDAMIGLSGDSFLPRIDIVTEVISYQNANRDVCAAVGLSIFDNGTGFSPGILARAFEPYVTSKSRGTGLGLAMVKKIIDEHGGRIDIQNRLDKSGAKVFILLLQLAK